MPELDLTQANDLPISGSAVAVRLFEEALSCPDQTPHTILMVKLPHKQLNALHTWLRGRKLAGRPRFNGSPYEGYEYETRSVAIGVSNDRDTNQFHAYIRYRPILEVTQ